MNNILQKTKSNTLDKVVVERLHNSSGYRPRIIARLELLIEESQIFFNIIAAGLSSMGKIARLSTLVVGKNSKCMK
jgi:hypothetical protein